MTAGAVLRWLFGPPDRQRMHVGLFVIALLLYLPGIWWGTPYATAPDRAFPWGSDELAPLGALGELYRVLLAPELGFNPQYPLFHYVVQAVFVVPFLAVQWLTGQVGAVAAEYPFGFRDPVTALTMTTLLSRVPSWLMGAGVVVAAARATGVLSGRSAGWFGGLAALVAYPMFYYSRTSNVDMAALFWTAAGFVTFASCLRDRLTRRRAVALGVFAALATGSKDASLFAFAGMVPGLIPWRSLRTASWSAQWNGFWKHAVVGAAVAAGVYVVASGLVLRPSRFFDHVHFISRSTAIYVYPDTVAGLLGLLRETVGHIVAALGLPLALLALTGVVRAVWRDPRTVWLLLPGVAVVLGTVVPVDFVNFRYVIIPSFVLTLYGALGLTWIFERPWGRGMVGPAVAVVVIGWSLVRGLDLTRQMIGDVRYSMATWLDDHVRPNESVAYFGAPQKLPALRADIRTVQAGRWCSEAEWEANRPEFVVVIPQQHFEIHHEWDMAASIYDRLVGGTLGYDRVVYDQTRSIWSRRPVPFVNPPVQIFVRRDRRLADMSSAIAAPTPLLHGVEVFLGLTPRFPPGLIHNVKRAPLPCTGTATSRGSATSAPEPGGRG